MKQYLELLHKALTCGEESGDRTGTGTKSLFGEVLKFDLRDGFPAVTTKRLAFKTMAAELSMFVKGIANLSYLHKYNCRIWDANYAPYEAKYLAKCEGDLGRIYGVQWRDYRGRHETIDQLKELIHGLKTNPEGRRHIVTAWNPTELGQMALPPCHVMFQCRIYGGKHLDLAVYMRSLDLFLGAPFDIASYALLQHLIAKEVGVEPRHLTMFIADCHIYNTHVEQVSEQLTREPWELPRLELSRDASLFEFEPDQASLVDYIYHPTIKAEMAV